MPIAPLSLARLCFLLCAIAFFAVPTVVISPLPVEQAIAATDAERLGITEDRSAGQGAVSGQQATENRGGSLFDRVLGPLAGMGTGDFSAVDLLLVLVAIYLCLRLFRARSDRSSGQAKRLPPDDNGQESAEDAMSRWRKGTPYRASEYRDEKGDTMRGNAGHDASRGVDDDDPRANVKRAAQSAWDRLRSTPESSPSTRSLPGTPRDFDEADFLAGAKLLYSRLQRAWAARNIGDLEPFLTPDMLALLREQIPPDQEPSNVEVVYVEATLLEVTREGDEERTKVLFSALLQDDGDNSDSSVEVRELWHFTHNYQTGSNWQLDGIEAVSEHE